MLSMLLVLAGAAQLFTNMSFGVGEHEVLVRENVLRIVPPYILLLASITLCVWMPSAMYTAIMNTIKIIGGTIHG